MPADYPDAIPAERTMGPNLGSNPHSSLHDDAWSEINAIATELGTLPKGTDSDVKARLDRIEAAQVPVTSAIPFTPTWDGLTPGSATVDAHYRYQDGGRSMRIVVRVTFAANTSVTGPIRILVPDSATVDHNWAVAYGLASALDDTAGGNNASQPGYVVKEPSGNYLQLVDLNGDPFDTSNPLPVWEVNDVLGFDFVVPITPA